MYHGVAVIDTHGHMSTPPQFRAYAYNLIALRSPAAMRLSIPDEQMDGALRRHLRIMDERAIDLQLVSPRPVAMMHWERPFLVQAWTETTNDVIASQCRAHPTRLAGVAQLPQSSECDTANCVAELQRRVAEGFVGALVNPDPGADRRTPAMSEPYWFPLYEAAQDLGATLVVHPSISRDPRLEAVSHGYQQHNMAEETLATMHLEQGEVFERYPGLRVLVCHCGGAPRRLLQAGQRLRVGASEVVVRSSAEREGGQVGMPVTEVARTRRDLRANLFFDTCAYDPDFLATAIRQRGVAQMVFGTEAPGAGTGVLNPVTGRPSDDLVPVIDAMDFLSAEDRTQILHHNPRAAFPLLPEPQARKSR
ncbi:amidohydrolase family protein [Pseudonocardia acaciae]|uniref:amidohydrolase family protein n=1 Tax=Pseudonocardia acaciae TaxID=551276 RepID=UPI0012EE6955|nr:amidohydrolase family protein [Pseudonocardia acaciae]